MVNTYAAQSGGCRFESLWGFGFSLKGAYYEVGYCGKKTFLAGLQCTLTSSCAKTGRDYRVPPLSFFRHCATFFRNFFCPQRVPPSSFLIFCNGMYVNKSRRIPFYIFRHYATFFERNFKFFAKKMFCAF